MSETFSCPLKCQAQVYQQPGSFPRNDLLTDMCKRSWDVSLLHFTGEDEEEPDAFAETSALLR